MWPFKRRPTVFDEVHGCATAMRERGLLWEADDLESALGGATGGEVHEQLALVLDSLLARAGASPTGGAPESLVESDNEALREFRERLQLLKAQIHR